MTYTNTQRRLDEKLVAEHMESNEDARKANERLNNFLVAQIKAKGQKKLFTNPDAKDAQNGEVLFSYNF